MLTKVEAQPVVTFRSALGLGAAASTITALSAYCAMIAFKFPVVKVASARSATRVASASVSGGDAWCVSFMHPAAPNKSGIRTRDRIGRLPVERQMLQIGRASCRE